MTQTGSNPHGHAMGLVRVFHDRAGRWGRARGQRHRAAAVTGGRVAQQHEPSGVGRGVGAPAAGQWSGRRIPSWRGLSGRPGMGCPGRPPGGVAGECGAAHATTLVPWNRRVARVLTPPPGHAHTRPSISNQAVRSCRWGDLVQVRHVCRRVSERRYRSHGSALPHTYGIRPAANTVLLRMRRLTRPVYARVEPQEQEPRRQRT